jgi:hypothetical protein
MQGAPAVADCIVCAMIGGQYDNFYAIVERYPEKIIELLTAHDSVSTCTNKHCIVLAAFTSLCRIVFSLEKRTFDHIKILDKILEMSIEQLAKCDLTYSKDFSPAAALSQGYICELNFRSAINLACYANNIKYAEKILSIVKTVGLDLARFFSKGSRYRFLDFPLGEGFVFYLKNCGSLTEQDVIEMADSLLDEELKHEFYVFFDLIAKHKLSKQTIAEYVTKKSIYFK